MPILVYAIIELTGSKYLGMSSFIKLDDATAASDGFMTQQLPNKKDDKVEGNNNDNNNNNNNNNMADCFTTMKGKKVTRTTILEFVYSFKKKTEERKGADGRKGVARDVFRD